MGKYMKRNSKTTRDVSLIDFPSHGGVRTRAKTLALQKAAVSSAAGAGSGSYIQLRSRRLVKPKPQQKENRLPPKPNKNSSKRAVSSGIKVNSVNSDDSVHKLVDLKEGIRQEGTIRVSENLGVDDEGSIGENLLEIEGRESARSTRETTPCNLIRDPEAITTPGSSTKRAYSTNVNYRVQNSAPSHIPTTIEMDEFFTVPEKQQQQQFIEKYNFDPVNDKPLPGRFEWVKMDGTKNVN